MAKLTKTQKKRMVKAIADKTMTLYMAGIFTFKDMEKIHNITNKCEKKLGNN